MCFALDVAIVRSLQASYEERRFLLFQPSCAGNEGKLPLAGNRDVYTGGPRNVPILIRFPQDIPKLFGGTCHGESSIEHARIWGMYG
jgi:hypothetical protein